MLIRPLTPGFALALMLAAVNVSRAAEPIGLLVTPADLQERRGEARLRVLDVRSQQEYAAGHIPGAIRVDVGVWKDLALSEDGLTSANVWSQQVGLLGIDNETNVVVSGGNPTNATRVWWTLKYVGVEHAGILDGGWEAWRDAGAPVQRTITQVKAAEFKPEFQADRLADISDVQSVLKDQTATIIDTRSNGEYAGTRGSGPRLGHIPGAVHQEWTNFVTADGRFKPVAEIKTLLSRQGLTPRTNTITHCQTGGRASLNCFAMELAGYGPVKNYYCGWSQWSGAENAPVRKP